MKTITQAQLRALADRCESAIGKRCKCRCGGALHGIAHSDEWISEEVQRDRIAAISRPSEQLDWIGFDDIGALPVVWPESSLLSVPTN